MKTYVITGATSGIGNALTKEYAKNNIVFAGYRNEKYLADLISISENVIPFYIDMEKPESIKNASEFIKSKTDKIDTLINVAGCVVAGVVEQLPIEKLKKQFDVNTFSHIDFTQKLYSQLKIGKVINISSMASFGLFPFISPYCASKRALDIFFNAFSLESGLKVVSIKPGVIATPLWDKSINNNQESFENCKKFEKEMKYMVSNASKNGVNGLKVEKVVEKIVKIDKMKNPKTSYTIGLDAKMAELFSRLPFDIQYKIVKMGMDFRITK